ncbi:hypothetical protein V8E36_000326 [Tilletia maclaganii]
MNSSHDLAAALNRAMDASSALSPARFIQPRASRTSESPAPGGSAYPAITSGGPTRRRPQSVSPDLFYTSSRGGSPDSSDPASSESQIGERTPSRAAAQASKGIDRSSRSKHEPPGELSGDHALFRDNADAGPSSAMSSQANPPRMHAAKTNGHSRQDPHEQLVIDAPPLDNGDAAIRFQDEKAPQSDDEDDLWGGPVSPSTSKSSPVKSSHTQRPPQASTSSRPRQSAGAASARSSKRDHRRSPEARIRQQKHAKADWVDISEDEKDWTVWVDVPILNKEKRKQYTVVSDFKEDKSRSRRRAAAGAREKNRQLAALTNKPLVLSDGEEDEDETRSTWFDPQRRKQSQEQRRRRADPSKRGERAEIRSSQQTRLSGSDSDGTSASEVSFVKLDVDLSQIPTVATKIWGTPEADDAAQGLRAAPKDLADDDPSRPSTSAAGASALVIPNRPAKKKAQEPIHSFEELFLQQSNSSDEGDLPPPSSAAANKGQARASAGQPARTPAKNSATKTTAPPQNGNRLRLQEESDDDFVPIERPPPVKAPAAATASKAAAATKPRLNMSTQPTPTATSSNGHRVFPKPAVAPLPAIPLKLPPNMHPPTGMVLSRDAYEKEDRRRKRNIGANGAAKKTADQRKRHRSSDSDRSPSPEHRGRARKQVENPDSDFEVTDVRDAYRTPQSGARPQPRQFSSNGRQRSDSLSPPRRRSGTSFRMQERSVTPSSASEGERARRRKGGRDVDKGKKKASSSKVSKDTRTTKVGPPSRSFVMPDSQPPRKKLKSMTFKRDKILGSTGRVPNGSPRPSETRKSQQSQNGGIDYGRAEDDSDDDEPDRARQNFGSPAVLTRRAAREAGTDEEEELLSQSAPKNLQSDLNEEAWTYTAGTHKNDVYRDNLGKLRKARKLTDSQRAQKGKGKRRKGKSRATTEESSETSDSYAASTGDSSLSSNSRWKNKADLGDFVVDDDDQPIESLSRRVPRNLTQSQASPSKQPRASGSGSHKQSSQHRSRRRGSDSEGSDRRGRGRGRGGREAEREMQPSDYIRLERERIPEETVAVTLEDAYWWEMVYLIFNLLDQQIPVDNRKDANRGRRMLEQRMSDGQRALSNMVIRKNFRWYLKTYPKMLRITLTSDEVRERQDSFGFGCGMCRRTKQRPESRICLYGRPYGPDLTIRNPSEVSSSDCDSEQQDEIKEKHFKPLPNGGKGKKNWYAFYVGSKCAMRAELLHKVLHWEVMAQEETKRICGDRLDDWLDKDFNTVQALVQKYVSDNYPMLQKFCERIRTEAMDFDRNGR